MIDDIQIGTYILITDVSTWIEIDWYTHKFIVFVNKRPSRITLFYNKPHQACFRWESAEEAIFVGIKLFLFFFFQCKKYEHFSKPRLSQTSFIVTHFADKVYLSFFFIFGEGSKLILMTFSAQLKARFWPFYSGEAKLFRQLFVNRLTSRLEPVCPVHLLLHLW